MFFASVHCTAGIYFHLSILLPENKRAMIVWVARVCCCKVFSTLDSVTTVVISPTFQLSIPRINREKFHVIVFHAF
jgi:hypothetical protein